MRPFFLALLLLTGLNQVARTDDRPPVDRLLPLPELDADPAIPTLEAIVGHAWAHDISSHAEIERYLQALSAAAPNRARLVRYGESYERRGLYYLAITSPDNFKRLDDIRRDNLNLADPASIDEAAARQLIENAPAIVWLAYSVHGNEISSSDAALLTAYHLLADRRAETQRWLDQAVVIIDPLQNPDGRDRFVNVYRETRGVFPDSTPVSTEHVERWPGGRTNHYYFDMNRDWFLQGQQETRHKAAAYLEWRPQIYVDAHEMGANSTYYFAPPTDPINPLLLTKQHQWLFRIGRHQAAQFDKYGFRYTTREMFDAFYPGYGSEWPTLQGGLGILWEQASSRGLVIDRDDETKLNYHDGVRHHYVSGLATVEVAVENRRDLLDDFHGAAEQALRLPEEGPVRHYFLLEGNTPHRARQLAQTLLRNGVRVGRTTRAVTAECSESRDGQKAERTIPPGSFHISVAQPAGRLVRSILDRSVTMDQEFVQKQLDRNKLFLPDQIYDVTAWSLPLAFGVTCLATIDEVDVEADGYDPANDAGSVPDSPPKVAYLVRGTDGATRMLAWWLRQGLRVHVTDAPFRLGDERFAAGTLLLLRRENGEAFDQQVREGAELFGVEVLGADTGFVDDGSHFGGPQVHWVRPPKVAMIVGRPASYSCGHTWYLFDQRLKYPVTRVAGSGFGRLRLSDFNVIVLPHGRYSSGDGFDESQADRLRDWVSGGGTLVLVGGAAAWAAGLDQPLLPTKIVQRAVEGEGSEEAEPVMVAPNRAPGAFLRADVFDQHWTTFGFESTADLFYSGNLIFEPLNPAVGRNVVTFVDDDRLLVSGFCWPETLRLISGTPYLLYRSRGDGHIIAFTDDPNYRAMYPGLQRLFTNAVMFGPGH